MQKDLNSLLKEIYLEAEKAAPKEMCGFIIQQNNKTKWILCENKSENKNEFKIDGHAFVKYQLTSKILYVVHSHYMEDCKPSQHDINGCNEVDIPYLIVSYPQKEHYILEPA